MNEVKESSIKPQLPQPLYQEAHRHQPLTILATPAVQSHTNMTVGLGVQWLWQIKPDAFPNSLSEKHLLIKSDEGEHSLGKVSHYMCKTKSKPRTWHQIF